MYMSEHNNPEWLISNERIDEGLFVKDFLQMNPMKYVGGIFYTTEGALMDEDILRRQIYDLIFPYVSSTVSRRVNSLMELLRLEAWCEALPVSKDLIHISNGTFSIENGFTIEKQICRNRLPVIYNTNLPEPQLWLSFLEDLLEKEDIPTLQEYMGYCLIPTTCGQKMLSIIGNGGEGKSRIGVVMKAMLGRNMASGSLAKIEMSPFARADLENLLLFVDDDLKMEALTQTNQLKTIITADTPMDLERKYAQSYQGQLHVRFLAFGNASLQALNDQSHGFFRRQIILRAKPLPLDRVDDPFLGQKLVAERDSIFQWALEGLYRLIQNDYRFSISNHAMENKDQLICTSDTIRSFLDSHGYVRMDPLAWATSRELFQSYLDWCCENGATPLTSAGFYRQMQDHGRERGLVHSNNLITASGRSARGFRGIRICR